MDLSLPGSTNAPLSTAAVFADNVQDLLGTGTLQVHPSAIITVNSIDDAVNSSLGVTTLRDAINQANADTGGEDMIVFDRSLFSSQQTISLNLGELDITKGLDIIAPRDSLTGGDLVTVSGNKASRVFEIEAGATVTLSGLIIADGNVTPGNGGGGGINNSGILTLDDSIVRGGSAYGGFFNNVGINTYGGGIYNSGTMNVRNSTITSNTVGSRFPEFSGFGAGIYNTGTLEVTNSTISGNSASGRSTPQEGGGIYNSGTAKVSNSTLNNNSAGSNTFGSGGGIYNRGNLEVSNSTLNNNSTGSNASGGTGGGILNAGGTLEVSNSTLSGNSADAGGGISNSGISTVSNSTLSGNSAAEGGGIYNGGGTMTVSNSTLSGNSATKSAIAAIGGVGESGGGIYNTTGIIYNGSGNSTGTLTLVFCTLTLNQAANGSGVFNSPEAIYPFALSSPSTANVRNTIIANNLPTLDGINPDVSGTFTSNGYNLIGDSTGSSGFGVTGDIVGTSNNPIDPGLAPLDFYGGDTQTIALLPDSPAIGAADPTVLDTDPTTDQRGLPRRPSDVGSDIGAFEFS